jgi:ribosome recycling factor
LNINLPPPTKESRDAAIADAKKAGETALTNIRNARAANQKRLRNMEIKKLALPDELKKAHKDMDNIIKKADLDAKKTVEHAQKAMEKA